jgi:hypothetical protein
MGYVKIEFIQVTAQNQDLVSASFETKPKDEHVRTAVILGE